MEKPYVVGIDIGAQTAKLGLVDARGNIMSSSVIVSNDTTDEHVFIGNLCQAINRLLPEGIALKDVRGIGIGAPNGNFHKGSIERAPNLTWGGMEKLIPFADLVTASIGLPVKITNDANAAALGEMYYGAAKGMNDFIMITLGTGVGSGIVTGGKLLYGHDGFAGELGHTCSVRNNGRLCGCGRTGCLEAYASAIGVARTAREFLQSQPQKQSLLRDITPQEITSKDVSEAAIRGDEIACEVFEFTGKILGEALSDFVAFSAPEAIILFGGLVKSGDLIMNPVKEHLERNLLRIWQGQVKVRPSILKESDAAILGASALAWEI